MTSVMIKNLRKGNAIPLLLSRINKAKVYRGWEHKPRTAKPAVSAAWRGLADPAGRRLTHQGTKLAKGAWYSTAQTLLAAGLPSF